MPLACLIGHKAGAPRRSSIPETRYRGNFAGGRGELDNEFNFRSRGTVSLENLFPAPQSGMVAASALTDLRGQFQRPLPPLLGNEPAVRVGMKQTIVTIVGQTAKGPSMLMFQSRAA